MTQSQVFTAALMTPSPGQWVAGGGLEIRDGFIQRVLESSAATKRAALKAGCEVQDLGQVLLAPGLVNAHAHLELSHLGGEIKAPGGMFPWVREVLAKRMAASQELALEAALRGQARMLATGTTLVGDIDAEDILTLEQRRAGPRTAILREALDAGSPSRRTDVLRRLERALPKHRLQLEGLSPHAPHTVSEPLLSALAKIAMQRSAPVQVHWSESEEECQWCLTGEGPFGELLGPSSGRSGLERLRRAGLLGPRTSLVHGNHPAPGEARELGSLGVSLVHCPGSHRYFGRGSFPLEDYRRAGVCLALGSDSLASNEDLDMRREMSLLRSSHPSLAPLEVWKAATVGGAQALGLASRAGEFKTGAWADMVTYADLPQSPESLLEALTADLPSVEGVWIDGQERALGATGT